MQTSLKGIANKAVHDKTHRFQYLIMLLNAEFLFWCWQFVNLRASSGVDKISAAEYAQDLSSHTENLAKSVAGNWYRAKLVLRKYIPKLNGKSRGLGVLSIADKLLQVAVVKILEAIYEQDFLPCSFGYRQGRGAHSAIKELSAILRSGQYGYVVEADIKGFFNSINHNKLLNMLLCRINDKRLLKLIRRWLKAGILDTDGQVLHPSMGTPQGGIISPLLANVYLHYALDIWFEETVRKHSRGKVYLCRYADDFVCVFELESDARRFYAVLRKRLARYDLEVAEEKTGIFPFDKNSRVRFEFLGFEFYWGNSRWGRKILKRRTSREKFRASLANFKVWCKVHGGLPKAVLFAKLNRKLRGYSNYYGIRGNSKSLCDYFYHMIKLLYKWLNRRSQRSSYTEVGFRALLEDFKLLKPRICHNF